MLDLQQLETFRIVAGMQNFTRAAAALGYSQSTVTTQIQSLEREVGARLLMRWRFSRQVALTQAGQRILAYADRLLELAAEAKASARPERVRPR